MALYVLRVTNPRKPGAPSLRLYFTEPRKMDLARAGLRRAGYTFGLPEAIDCNMDSARAVSRALMFLGEARK